MHNQGSGKPTTEVVHMTGRRLSRVWGVVLFVVGTDAALARMVHRG